MPSPSSAQKFAALTRDIDWQRASFLSNNLEIVWTSEDASRTSYAPSEIIVRKIFDHYFLLALLYYRQLRDDLKNEFSANRISEREVKISMQDGLEKLVVEWYRVYAVILAIRANQSTGKARNIIQEMYPVLQTAREDVYLSPDFLAILHFGQDFSMRFFNYMENIAALNMPLATFESPWEWTILWHELAGEKVRSMKNDDPYFFAAMFYEIMSQLDEAQAAEAEALGWSVDWLEELFEDSFSVVNFPIHFLYVLKNLLERRADLGGKGSRHPPQAVRLAAAMYNHLLEKGLADSPDLQGRDEAVWRDKWDELKDGSEREPRRFAEFDPAVLLAGQPVNLAVTRLAAEKILAWHNQQTRWGGGNSAVRELIGNAIIGYSRGDERGKIFAQAIAALQPVKDVAGMEREQPVTDQALTQIERIVHSKSVVENNPALDSLEGQNPRVRRLLHDGSHATAAKLGYKDLLAIRFNDVDFVVETVTNVTYKGVLQFGDGVGKLNRILANMPPSGLISFRLSTNEDKRTTVIAWNNSAAPGFAINP